jgi:hemerythrin-like domain-containing protein
MCYAVPMDVTDALIGEHGVFHLLVEQLDDAVARLTTVAELRSAAAPLSMSLLAHARIEEETLFDPLERAIGVQGPLQCLRDEHVEMDRRLRAMFHLPDLESLKAEVRAMVDMTRKHLAKEEKVLFNVAKKALPGDDRQAMGARWADFRGVTLPI